MADNRKHDDPLAGLLAHSLRSASGGTSAGNCPDAETLASYFDRSLSASETAHCEHHFSVCARCQEQLAALARSEPAINPSPREATAAPGLSFWDWRWLAPMAAALGVLVLWVAVRPEQSPQAPADAGVLQSANRQPVATPTAGASSAESTARAADAASPTALTKVAPPKDAPSRVLEADRKIGEVADTKPVRGEEVAAAFGRDRAAAERPAELARNAAAPGSGAISAARSSADEGRRARDAAIQGKLTDKLEKTESLRSDAAQKVAAAENAQRESKLDQSNQAQNVAPSANAAQQMQAPAKKVPDAQNVQQNQVATAQQAVQVEAAALTDEKEKQADTRAAEARRMATMKESGSGAKKVQEDLSVRQQTAAEGYYAFRSNEANLIRTPVKNILWRFGPGSRIARSTDAGDSWQEQSNPAKAEILSASAPSDSVCWVVGRSGTILRTTNGGSAWEKIASPAGADLLSIVAQDAGNATITAAGGKRFSTSDGGRSWQPGLID